MLRSQLSIPGQRTDRLNSRIDEQLARVRGHIEEDKKDNLSSPRP